MYNVYFTQLARIQTIIFITRTKKMSIKTFIICVAPFRPFLPNCLENWFLIFFLRVIFVFITFNSFILIIISAIRNWKEIHIKRCSTPNIWLNSGPNTSFSELEHLNFDTFKCLRHLKALSNKLFFYFETLHFWKYSQF